MNFFKHIHILKRGIMTLLKIEKIYVILMILTSVIAVVPNYITIYLMATITDELVHGQDRKLLIIYVFITILSNLILSLIISGLGHMQTYHRSQFQKNETMFLAKKLMSMDFCEIENHETQMLYERIKGESQSGFNTNYLCNFLSGLILNIAKIVGAILLLVELFFNQGFSIYSKLFVILSIAVTIVINNVTNRKKNGLQRELMSQNVRANTFFNFYEGYYDDYNAGKDIRIYNMEEFIADDIRKHNDTLVKLNLEFNKKSMALTILNSGIIDIFNSFIYIFIILACVSGNISIGNMGKYIGCIALIVTAANGLMTSIQMLCSNNRYLLNYFQFLDIPSQMREGTLQIDHSLDGKHVFEFHGVSFRYPATDGYALKDISLCIKQDTKSAIVGMNGSGKTTFIKLFCRLYDPTEGEILLDGVDIRKYQYDEYIALFSVVFQDFKIYAYPLGQTIACKLEYDTKKVELSLKHADFGKRLATLPEGVETCLYKAFDESGVELSGGEAQKVAIARALYKNAPFVILDEPTAALDPISEAEIYASFNKTFSDYTSIYISHRLSSCRFCDHIIVFHEGRIVQQGSHDALVSETDGKYAELWNAQAKYYA